ncbi:MAG: REP-associated tyrosine transposase [Planctomycetota bacterium]
MSKSRYKVYHPAEPHFLTCVTVAWLPVFTRPEAAERVLDSLRFLIREGSLTLYGWVLMENHLHLIAQSPDLPAQMARFKSFTGRQIVALLKQRGDRLLLRLLHQFKDKVRTNRPYQLWQEGNHPQLIQGDAMMQQKLEYLHGNPVRRGYVDEPRHWRYSSARDYDGVAGLLPVVTGWR